MGRVPWVGPHPQGQAQTLSLHTPGPFTSNRPHHATLPFSTGEGAREKRGVLAGRGGTAGHLGLRSRLGRWRERETLSMAGTLCGSSASARSGSEELVFPGPPGPGPWVLANNSVSPGWPPRQSQGRHPAALPCPPAKVSSSSYGHILSAGVPEPRTCQLTNAQVQASSRERAWCQAWREEQAQVPPGCASVRGTWQWSGLRYGEWVGSVHANPQPGCRERPALSRPPGQPRTQSWCQEPPNALRPAPPAPG